MNPKSEIEPFPNDLVEVNLAFESEQCWYVFVFAITSFIVVLKGCSSLCGR